MDSIPFSDVQIPHQSLGYDNIGNPGINFGDYINWNGSEETAALAETPSSAIRDQEVIVSRSLLCTLSDIVVQNLLELETLANLTRLEEGLGVRTELIFTNPIATTGDAGTLNTWEHCYATTEYPIDSSFEPEFGSPGTAPPYPIGSSGIEGSSVVYSSASPSFTRQARENVCGNTSRLQCNKPLCTACIAYGQNCSHVNHTASQEHQPHILGENLISHENRIEHDSLNFAPSFISAESPPISTIRSNLKKSQLPLEGVSVLDDWFAAHRDHPYPTASEKTMLVQASGLSRKQVDTWFSNTRARRTKQLDPMNAWLSTSSDDEAVSETDIRRAISHLPVSRQLPHHRSDDIGSNSASNAGSAFSQCPKARRSGPPRRGRRRHASVSYANSSASSGASESSNASRFSTQRRNPPPRSFVRKFMRNLSLNLSNKRFECAICNERFERHAQLDIHLSMHDQETRTSCFTMVADKVYTNTGQFGTVVILDVIAGFALQKL